MKKKIIIAIVSFTIVLSLLGTSVYATPTRPCLPPVPHRGTVYICLCEPDISEAEYPEEEPLQYTPAP